MRSTRPQSVGPSGRVPSRPQSARRSRYDDLLNHHIALQRSDCKRAIQAEVAGERQKDVILLLRKDKDRLAAQLREANVALAQSEAKAQHDEKLLFHFASTKRELFEVMEEKEALKLQLRKATAATFLVPKPPPAPAKGEDSKPRRPASAPGFSRRVNRSHIEHTHSHTHSQIEQMAIIEVDRQIAEDEAADEAAEAADRQAELEQALATLQSRVDAVTKDNDVLRMECKSLQSVVEEKNEEVGRLQCGVDQLQSVMQEKNEEVGSLQCGVDQLQNVVQEKNEEVGRLQCGVHQLQSVVQEKNEEVGRLQCGVDQKAEGTVRDQLPIQDPGPNAKIPTEFDHDMMTAEAKANAGAQTELMTQIQSELTTQTNQLKALEAERVALSAKLKQSEDEREDLRQKLKMSEDANEEVLKLSEDVANELRQSKETIGNLESELKQQSSLAASPEEKGTNVINHGSSLSQMFGNNRSGSVAVATLRDVTDSMSTAARDLQAHLHAPSVSLAGTNFSDSMSTAARDLQAHLHAPSVSFAGTKRIFGGISAPKCLQRSSTEQVSGGSAKDTPKKTTQAEDEAELKELERSLSLKKMTMASKIAEDASQAKEHQGDGDPLLQLTQEYREMLVKVFQRIGRNASLLNVKGQIDWAQAFTLLDTDGKSDGILSKGEFMNGFGRLAKGCSFSMREQLHKLLDRDRSGMIAREEWSILEYYHTTLCTPEGRRMRTKKHEYEKKLGIKSSSNHAQSEITGDNGDQEEDKEVSFTDEDLSLVIGFVDKLKQVYHRDVDNRLVDFESVFISMDNNSNGLLSMFEFSTFVKKMQKGLQSMLRPQSTDRKQSTAESKELTVRDARRLFQFLDKDKSGLIGKEEINMLEYYVGFHEKLAKKLAYREMVEAEYKRQLEEEERKEKEEQARKDKLREQMRTLKLQKMGVRWKKVTRSYSERMLTLGDEGWIEFDILGKTIQYGEQGPKFIVATDGSASANTALQFYTDFWAWRMRPSYLSVVHVVAGSNKELAYHRAKNIEDAMKTWLRTSLDKKRFDVQIADRENHADKARKFLSRQVREQEGQFLLAGAIGAKSHKLHKTIKAKGGIGGTAFELMQHAKIPVMLVPDDVVPPQSGEPCLHVVAVKNDQASLKAFVDCMRLAGPDDRVEVVHVTGFAESPILKLLLAKYEYIFEMLGTYPDDKDPKSLPGMLKREGPWPSCKFTVLDPLKDGTIAETIWDHINKTDADFAYVGAGHWHMHNLSAILENMTCPTVVSEYSHPMQIISMQRRHEQKTRELNEVEELIDAHTTSRANSEIYVSKNSEAYHSEGSIQRQQK